MFEKSLTKCDWKIEKCDPHNWESSCFCFHQACVLQRQRKGSVSSDASASTDSNTYYEDDFSSTEEDSSQGTSSFWIFAIVSPLQKASLKFRVHARVCTHIAAPGSQNERKKILPLTYCPDIIYIERKQCTYSAQHW